MRKFLRVCLFVAAAFVLFVYVRLTLDVGQPYLGVVLSNWTSELYQVDPATPSVWRNVQIFPPGTSILAVDGESVDGVSNPVLKAWQAGRTEVTVSYVLPNQPDTEVLSRVVPIQLFSWLRYIELVFQFGLPALMCFLLAISILNTHQNFDWRAVAAIIGAIFFILRQDDRGIPSSVIYANAPTLPIDHIIQLVSRFVYGSYWFPVIALLLAFPSPIPKIERWLRIASVFAIMTAIIIAAPYIACIMGLHPDIAKQWELNTLAVMRTFYSVVVLGFVVLAIRSVWQYKKHPSQHWLALVPIPIFAVLGTLYWLTVYLPAHENLFLPQVSDFFNQSLQGMNRIKYNFRPFYMVAGLIITSIILRHQTFHTLDSLFVFTAPMIISCCFAAVIDLLVRFVSVDNEFWIAPIIPLFFVVFALTEYMSFQIKNQGWMWRMFNRHLISQQISQGLITRHQDLHQPMNTQQMVETITKEFALERCALWSWHEIDQTFELLGTKSEGHTDTLAALATANDAGSQSYLIKRNQLILPNRWQTEAWVREGGQVPSSNVSSAFGLFESMSAYVPLQASQRCLGLLTFGKRRDEPTFHAQDLHLLDTIASNVALILLGNEQLNALKRLPFQIAQAQERERQHISNELHDSTQQFLGRLPIYMATLLESARQGDDARAEQLLAQYEDEIRRESLLVRRLRSSLSPITIDHDFANSLRLLESRVAARSGLMVRVHCDVEVVNYTTALQRESLYRIIQQAFDNAVQHARASILTASLRINCAAHQIEFEIDDDGCGIEPDRPAQARIEGRYGLTIMQNRAQSNGGDCHIDFAPGFGTRVYGWLPIASPELAAADV